MITQQFLSEPKQRRDLPGIASSSNSLRRVRIGCMLAAVLMMGSATAWAVDCNLNGVEDSVDVSSGTSADCNANGMPDACETLGNDCNANGIPDDCEPGAADCVPVDCVAPAYRTLRHPGAIEEDLFGQVIALDGNRVVIAAPRRGTFNSGSVNIFRFVKDRWRLEQTLAPDFRDFASRFGTRMDLDGDTLMIYTPSAGCPLPPTNTTFSYIGFYDFDGTRWNHTATINGFAFDENLSFLGDEIGLSGDTAVAAGSYFDDTRSLFVLQMVDGEWGIAGRFADLQQGSYVDGSLVKVEFVDDLLVVIQRAQLTNGTEYPGTVFFYRYDGSQFVEEFRLDSPKGTPPDLFWPTEAAISADTSRVVVSESSWPLPGSPPNMDHNGRFFVLDHDGSNWLVTQTIEAASSQIRFLGTAIDLRGDRMVVTAPDSRSLDDIDCRGAAFIYELIGGIWQETSQIWCDPTFPNQLGEEAVIGDDFVLAFEEELGTQAMLNSVLHVRLEDSDCNADGQSDGCEVVAGSVDCDGNRLPDACEPFIDCDASGVRDACEIADGTVPDCNDNGIPDACDIAAGTSGDCRGNGIPDECESPDCDGNGTPDDCDIAIAPGTDCDGNGIPDVCDTSEDPRLDCNGNLRPDACDLTDGTSQDADGDGVPDECVIAQPLVDDTYNTSGAGLACASDEDCFGESVCVQSACYVPKNRFLTIKPNPVNINKSYGYRIAIDAGVAGILELGYANTPNSSGVSEVVQAPIMVDWYDYFNGDGCYNDGRNNVLIADCEIVPGRTYFVQAVWGELDPLDESDYSAPLVLPTVTKYGDAVGGGTPSLPPDGNANFVDILAAVGGFRRDGVTIDSWLEVDWLAAPSLSVSFVDVQQFVIAFQNGGQYGGPDPFDCP